MTKKHGILFVNLGTPVTTSYRDIKKYLRQFLLDPLVIELPSLLRWLLVNCIIIPFRYKKTTAAYRTIWQQEGSPLLVNSINFINKITAILPDNYTTQLAMRYGNPSINSALQKLIPFCHTISIVPLFPQYSNATTNSVIQSATTYLTKHAPHISINIKDCFYNHQAFIDSLTAIAMPHLTDIEHLVFSYHGLPIRQTASHTYYNQCHTTAKLLAKKLELTNYSVSFQSRLGAAKWLQPYTECTLSQLAAKGIKKIAIICPSFVADCLETLEEIGIRLRKTWVSLGGTKFVLIPALNADDRWIQAAITIATDISDLSPVKMSR